MLTDTRMLVEVATVGVLLLILVVATVWWLHHIDLLLGGRIGSDLVIAVMAASIVRLMAQTTSVKGCTSINLCEM